MEYARVNRDIALPATPIWHLVRNFGGIADWVAGVTACVLEHGPTGVGAVRLVTLGERQVRERLLSLDDETNHLRYAVLPPHTLPAHNIRSTMLVEALDRHTTRIIWFSEADMTAPNPEMTSAIEGFFIASLARLEQLATCHPA